MIKAFQVYICYLHKKTILVNVGGRGDLPKK